MVRDGGPGDDEGDVLSGLILPIDIFFRNPQRLFSFPSLDGLLDELEPGLGSGFTGVDDLLTIVLEEACELR